MTLIQNQYPIADLHCDLLSHLAKSASHTPYDKEVRCSIDQLNAGGVKLQTMAIFTETGVDSSKNGFKQTEIYKNLPKSYPKIFEHLKSLESLNNSASNAPIYILAAIENASGICDEKENLDEALANFTKLQHKTGKFLYVSLTWNTENRFGGGAFTAVGLKEDGKRLINYLVEKNIAIDFSHTSDKLADDIFNYLEKQSLKPFILASHSNMRKVFNHPRNLNDAIAKEIISRKGIIGLNLIQKFIGEDFEKCFPKHLEHLELIGGSASVCFGADFFNEDDLPIAFRSSKGSFFEHFDNASCYPKIINVLKKELHQSALQLNGLAMTNLVNFLERYFNN